jgi:hypothetical protein
MQSATTAEWNCTRCGTTNRKLVPTATTEAKDRCVNCLADHTVKPAERPVRWSARLA